MIGVSQGIAFDVLGNQTIVAITEQKTHSVIYEYYLAGNSWLEVNRKNQKGKLKGAIVGPDFAIIQGADEHRIWFH